MIEATIDDGEPPQWPYGQIHLALKELYDTYRPKSRLDRIQLDLDKLTIKMAGGEHSDVLFEKALMVRKKYRGRSIIIKQSKVGDIPCSKLDKFGNHVNYTRINSVKFGKHNTFNLFSANNAMQYDWMCRGDRDRGWTIKNEVGDVVNFDIRISTGTSCIWCGYYKRHLPELVAAVPVKAIAPAAPAAKLIKMPIMKAHDLLGHGDQEKMKATAVALGWTICRGGWCRCVHCAKAKAKRKNIPKDTDHEKAEKPGGRIFTDITSVQKPKKEPKNLCVEASHAYLG
jgi:hypothetical protein